MAAALHPAAAAHLRRLFLMATQVDEASASHVCVVADMRPAVPAIREVPDKKVQDVIAQRRHAIAPPGR